MFYLLMPSIEKRTAFISHMKENGISATFHYMPLHLSDMSKRFSSKEGAFPVTEDISERLVRLPFFNDLLMKELRIIIDAIQKFQ